MRPLSCEGFGQFEIELPPGVSRSSAESRRLLDSSTVCVATTDVKDCFYRARVLEDLGRYFSPPAVPEHMFDGLSVRGLRAGAPPDPRARPCLAALPMGLA
eukprot:8713641-Pyramimonas_sp.AAC.1